MDVSCACVPCAYSHERACASTYRGHAWPLCVHIHERACALTSRVRARPLCTCAFSSVRARRRLVCVSAVCVLSTSPVNIKISENATPYHLNVACRVPIPLVPKVESELRRMERDARQTENLH